MSFGLKSQEKFFLIHPLLVKDCAIHIIDSIEAAAQASTEGLYW